MKLGLLFLAVGSAATLASAQGTAFTYQGRLNENGTPASRVYDLRFALYDLDSGGSEVVAALTNSAVAVSNGLFTVTLDFGAGVFTGADRWLEIAVRTNGNGVFTTLNPRQEITATPYAITASSASSASNLTGTLPAAQLSGAVASDNLAGTYSGALTLNNAANSISGSGAGLTALNASQLNSGTVPGAALSNAWKITGNAGTTPGPHFLGTTDYLPLELKVNGQRALRIEPANGIYGYCPNMVGGFSGNIVSNGYMGAVIGGGGYSGSPNRVGNLFATVVGGARNTASGQFSTAMGYDAVASGDLSIAMGVSTTASGTNSIAMGYFTSAYGAYSTAMGYGSTAAADYSTAMGNNSKAYSTGSFVWADAQAADFASTGNNEFCVRASGGVQLSGDTRMFFGSTLGQKINLYSTTFGMGIQQGVFYSRIGTGGGFGWYAGGVHNDNAFNAGSGGAVLMTLTSGGLVVNGTFVSASDRNLKQDFSEVNSRAVLEKVARLPIQTWAYKNDPGTKHLGPMAQDFYAAFGVGPDDKHITTVDESGVALAAIQGLNQKVEQQLEQKQTEITELKRRLDALEKLIPSQKSN